ncbi:MAG: hypothetical protein ACE5IT_08990 [bacterium]
MRRYLLLGLVLVFLLGLSTGCQVLKRKKGHLTAEVDSYVYSSSTGYTEVYFQLVNDGERDIDRYQIHYEVTYNSSSFEDKVCGLNLGVGETRTEYGVRFIGTGQKVTAVSVTGVDWKVD